jgi:hypothetical protein
VWDGLPLPAEFFSKYISRGMPVVFRNALSNGTGSLRHLFSKDVFLAKYGKEKVPVSAIPYARSFGKEGGVVDLEQALLTHLSVHLSHNIKRFCSVQ